MPEFRDTQAYAILDHSPDIVMRFDGDGRYLYINKAGERALGRPSDEVVGKYLGDLGAPGESAALQREIFRRVSGTEQPESAEMRYGDRLFQSLTVPEQDSQGKVVSFIVFSRDITDLKRTEEALRASEKSFIDVFETSPSVTVISSLKNGHIIAVNRAFEEASGYDRSEVLGKTSEELGLFPERALRAKLLQELKEKGRVLDREIVFRGKGGRSITGLTSLIPVTFRQQSCLLFVGIDITQRKQVDEALREREALLDTFINNTPAALIIYSDDNRYIRLNRIAAEQYGVPAAAARGLSIYDVLPPDLAAAVAERNRKVLESGRTSEIESYSARLPLHSENARKTYWQGFRFLVTLPGGKTGVGVVSLDVTERVQAEDTLRRNEYELRTLVDNSPDLIFRFDRQLRYTYANPAYERLTGVLRESFIGRTNRELGMPQQMTGLWESSIGRVIDSGQDHVIEFDMDSLFGKRYFYAQLIPEFARSGLVETVLVIARDITERRRAEEQIRYISFHDSVTGLFNRAFFEEEIRRVDTERDLPISIIMGDVNYLKLSNDVFGHMEGDRLLKTIAAAIRNTCRQSDIVARWGGDEFAVILPKTGLEKAGEIVARIRRTAAESGGTAVRPSIALGIAAKEQKDQNIYQVIRRSEERMYENKMAESRQNAENVLSKLMARARERAHDLTRHLDDAIALARRFGRELGLEEEQLQNLLLLVKMHDIGTAVIPGGILTKPGRLSEDEWKLVKKHPEAGYRIVKSFSDTARISDEVLSHDERWDGTGYPRGLKGREIPYLARVFALIEAYDVMTHRRPYARAFPPDEALEELRRNAGRQFDPELTEKFVALLKPREPAPALR